MEATICTTGLPMASAATIFMVCWRMLLLTWKKRFSSTFWPPNISTSLCPLSICSVEVVISPTACWM